MQQCRNYIGGDWVPSATGEVFESINPATGEVVAVAPRSGPRDVADAVAAARAAFDSGAWANTPGTVRAAVLRRFGERLRANCDRLAELLTRENGRTLTSARAEMFSAADIADYYAGLARTIAGEATCLSRETVNLTFREPVGVCGVIVPWNYPVNLSLWKIAPALAAGCAVVLKPSEHTPAISLELLKLFDEIPELPKGVVNGVAGLGDAGSELVRHPRVDKIAFTGSTATGKKILAIAADNLIRVSVECGGKSPNIVFADAPMPKAIDGAVWGIFRYSGQVCLAGSHLLVQDAIYDDFMAALLDRTSQIKVGNGLDPETQMGPLISEGQMGRVLGYIESGKSQGATLLCGGNRITTGSLRHGYFVAPTVFANVAPTMRIAQEEIFGPVLAVCRFRNDEDAVALANQGEYGLAAAVWTRDVGRAMQVGRAIRAGTVWVNTYHRLFPEAPFGGYKHSGLGRELGKEGLNEFLETKHLCLDSSPTFEMSR